MAGVTLREGVKIVREVAATGDMSGLTALGDLYADGSLGAVDAPSAIAAYQKALAGGPVSVLRLVAIRRALAARGLLHLLPEREAVP